MKDNLSIVITMLVFVVLIVIFPLYNYFERQDDMSYNLALKETTAFVDQVLNCGYIDQQMYNDYVDKLANTGNLYDIQLEGHQKVLSEESTDIYNEQYKIAYNKDIFDENGISTNNVDQKVLKNGAYYLNEGDQFYVRLKNTNTTMAGAIFNTIVPTSKKERIVVDYGGIVKNTAWNVVRQEYNALQYSFDVEVEIYLDDVLYTGNEITVEGAGRYLKGSEAELIIDNKIANNELLKVVINDQEEEFENDKKITFLVDSNKKIKLFFGISNFKVELKCDVSNLYAYKSIKSSKTELLTDPVSQKTINDVEKGTMIEATVLKYVQVKVKNSKYGDVYEFNGWKINGEIVSNELEYKFNAYNEMVIVASFKKMDISNIRFKLVYNGEKINFIKNLYQNGNKIFTGFEKTDKCFGILVEGKEIMEGSISAVLKLYSCDDLGNPISELTDFFSVLKLQTQGKFNCSKVVGNVYVPTCGYFKGSIFGKEIDESFDEHSLRGSMVSIDDSGKLLSNSINIDFKGGYTFELNFFVYISINGENKPILPINGNYIVSDENLQL